MNFLSVIIWRKYHEAWESGLVEINSLILQSDSFVENWWKAKLWAETNNHAE